MLKYILLALLVLSIGLSVYIYYGRWKLDKANDQLNEQLMEANLELGKAHTDFGNAQKEISKLDDALRDAINKNNETLTAYGQLKAKYTLLLESSGEGGAIPGNEVEPGEDLEPGMWYAAINKKDLIEIDNLIYKDTGQRIDWSIKIWPTRNPADPLAFNLDGSFKVNLTLRMDLVETITKSGAVNRYANIYDIAECDTLDDCPDQGFVVFGKYKITDFEYIVNRPKQSSFYWWSPHLDLAGQGGVNMDLGFQASFGLGVSFMGYGLTKNDLSWRFGRIGLELSNQDVGLSITPAQWNMAGTLPLISNVWIGPSASIFLGGQKALGIQIAVML